MRAVEHFSYYESIIESLARRGHELRVLFDKRWSERQPRDEIDQLVSHYSGLEIGLAVKRKESRLRRMLLHTRELLTYRQYLLLHRQGESIYYDRWIGYLPRRVQQLARFALFRAIVKSRFCGVLLRMYEKVILADNRIMRDIREWKPDAVVAGPINLRFSSLDLEYLKAAKALCIPTVLPVLSWDNLTTKGLIHIKPDLLLVWNTLQAEEAKTIHAIDADAIHIVGSPFFDRWFSLRKTAGTREDFCKRHGLRSSDPILLYLGSSSTVAPNEAWLIKELRAALDKHQDRRLRRIQLVLRPHPVNARHFEGLDADNLKVIPKGGHMPSRKGGLELFQETLAHSIAAVGINTSGMIDALIAGKPVIALMVDEYRSTQLIAQHFRYVLESGVVEQAEGVLACVATIGQLLEGQDAHRKEREKFVKEFVRPRGLLISAGETAAEEIVTLCHSRSRLPTAGRPP